MNSALHVKTKACKKPLSIGLWNNHSKSTGNMNFWEPSGFVCTWKCRKVHVDISDMRSHELISMISSTHMINIYVCHALVSCLTWATLTVQNYGRVGPHSTPIMTIYTITVDSGVGVICICRYLHTLKLSSQTFGHDLKTAYTLQHVYYTTKKKKTHCTSFYLL